jgi:hypothetical integral membrane protein (TIGR02206 family)
MAEPFILFGPAHLLTLLLIAAIGLALPLMAIRMLDAAWQYRLGLAIALLLVAQEALRIWLGATYYAFPLINLLPLHLCGLAVLLTAWTLALRSMRAYEIVYFWAWGGTAQALVTPDLGVGFPDPMYLIFFIAHGMVIVGVLYATLVYRFRPRFISIIRSTLALLMVVVIVAPINLWLETNYLFLSSKPVQASLIDHLGPWPWYILSLAGIAILSSLVYYLPFLIKDWRAGRAIFVGS